MTSTAKPLPPFDYSHAKSRLYDIAAGVSGMQLRDAIDSGFARLHAMLAMTTGKSGEAFRCYSDETQESFLEGYGLLVILPPKNVLHS